MGEYLVEAKNLCKYFKVDRKRVLKAVDGVNISIRKGETLGLVGESGCGKTTCGRTLLHLYEPTSGEILFHGKNMAGKGVNAPQYRSRVGMVFQSFNLFNNMTVLENCMVGQVKVLKKKPFIFPSY